MELISYFYTPTPQRRGTYGDVDALAGTPATLEEWMQPEWVAWMTHEEPQVPWMDQRLRARVHDFVLVLSSRFPSVHDTQAYGHLRPAGSRGAVTVLAPAQGYALWAPTYAAETAVSALEASVVASLDVPLRGKRVLDVGCGIARRLGAAREAGATVALGLDLTPAMLAQARGEPLLAAADARALPLADGAFDVVWCRLVLGHLPALEPAYRELARVCAPGGVVLVTDFHPAAATAGHRRTFRDADGALHELEHHVHRMLAHRVGGDARGAVAARARATARSTTRCARSTSGPAASTCTSASAGFRSCSRSCSRDRRERGVRLLIRTQDAALGVEAGRIVPPSGRFDVTLRVRDGILHPGLVNAHEHLHRNHYGRLGHPPYQDAYEWGADIHHRFADAIARGRAHAAARGAAARRVEEPSRRRHDGGAPRRVGGRTSTATSRCASCGSTRRDSPPARDRLARGDERRAVRHPSRGRRELRGGRRGARARCARTGHGRPARRARRRRGRARDRSGCAPRARPSSGARARTGSCSAAPSPPSCSRPASTCCSAATRCSPRTARCCASCAWRATSVSLTHARLSDAVGSTAARRLGIEPPSLGIGARADVIVLRRPLLEATEEDVAVVVAGGTLRVVDPALLPALGALAERGSIETADGVPRWLLDHGRAASLAC